MKTIFVGLFVLTFSNFSYACPNLVGTFSCPESEQYGPAKDVEVRQGEGFYTFIYNQEEDKPRYAVIDDPKVSPDGMMSIIHVCKGDALETTLIDKNVNHISVSSQLINEEGDYEVWVGGVQTLKCERK